MGHTDAARDAELFITALGSVRGLTGPYTRNTAISLD
jgi:hypothetical protein